MIKILQESLRLKLDSEETTKDIMLELSKLVKILKSYGIPFEKDWLEEFNNDIEFELKRG